MACSAVPTRVVIGLMIFGSVIVNLTMRVNLSLSILAMVPIPLNGTELKDLETLGWSAYERAHLLGCYSWSYSLGCMVGGVLAQRYGPRKLNLITSLISALLTFASPSVAKSSFVAFVILRILLGFLGAFPYPAASVLIAHWAVSYEKGMFSSTIVAGAGGTVIAWALSGVIIETFGWEWSFHVFGIATVLFGLLWWYCVYDCPSDHPRISKAELKYITDGTSGINRDKLSLPYRSVFTSVPVYALMVLYFGTGWGVNFFLTSVPAFIASVLRYNLSSTGYLSSVSYLGRSVCAFLFGFIGDYLLKRNLMPVKVLRKFFIIFSHIIPGCFMFALTLTENPLMAVAMIILAMTFTSAVTLTNHVNALDLAPNFNGALNGLGGTIAMGGGAAAPLVVAYFTKHDERSLEAWFPVFYISGGVYILSGLIFFIFGTTERQAWNEVGPKINKINPEEEKLNGV